MPIIIVAVVVIYANKVIGFYSYIKKSSFLQDHEKESTVVQGFREELKRCYGIFTSNANDAEGIFALPVHEGGRCRSDAESFGRSQVKFPLVLQVKDL